MAETTGAPAQPTSTEAPSQEAVSHPYIGSRISLISKSALRYEGTLYTIDTNESTVALQNVHSFGTEGRTRTEGPVPPCVHPYDFIIFRGQDIADLQVLPDRPPISTPYHDPAIIASAAPPQMAAPSYVAPVSQAQVHHTHQQIASRIQQSDRSHTAQASAAQPVNSVPNPAARESENEQKPEQNPDVAKSVGGPNPSQWGPPPTSAWGPPPRAPVREAGRNGVHSTPKSDTIKKSQEVQNDIPTQPEAPANRQQQSGRVNGEKGTGRRDGGGPREGGSRSNNWRKGGPNGDGRDRYGARGYGRGGYGRGGRRFRRRGPGITVPDEDFDFESMHEKFDKVTVNESVVDTTVLDELPDIAPKYDKSKGFFDDLIPEKQMPREHTNAAQRRATDFETFGEFGNFVRHHRYGGRRGRGRGRGRGRSYSNNRQTNNE